jgi:hypothetical protein
MQTQFLDPEKRPFDEYAVEKIQVSRVGEAFQEFVQFDVQSGTLSIEPEPPADSVIEFVAPRGFVVGKTLQVSSIQKYKIRKEEGAWRLTDLSSVLELFVLDTGYQRMQEGNNLMALEAGSQGKFKVILMDAVSPTSFWFGGLQEGSQVSVFLRVPEENPKRVTVVRIFLKPLKDFAQSYVVRFPLTHQEWVNRANLQTEHLIGDLTRFGAVDPLRRTELELVNLRAKGMLDLSTQRLLPESRKRLLIELHSRPSLVFVASLLLSAHQVLVKSPLTCPRGQRCVSLGTRALRVDSGTVLVDAQIFETGGTFYQFLSELVQTQQDALAPQYSDCFKSASATDAYVRLQWLRTLEKGIRLPASQVAVQPSPVGAPSPADQLNERAKQLLLDSLSRQLEDSEREVGNAFLDQILTSSERLLLFESLSPPLEAKGADGRRTVLSVVKDRCAEQLEGALRQVEALDAERNRQIETVSGIPSATWKTLGYDRTAYQFDLIPALQDIQTYRLVHRGEPIGFFGSLLEDAPGLKARQGLRLVFAIRNDREISVQSPDGQTVQVRALDFMMQRVNSDLKNVHYGDHTLVFDFDLDNVVTKAVEWVREHYPEVPVREVVIDTHGVEGGLLWGRRWYRPGQMRRVLEPLRKLSWSKYPNVFVNACQVGRDSLALFYLSSDFGLPVTFSIMASDEVYTVNKRQVVESEINRNYTAVLQYTLGNLLIADSDKGSDVALYRKKCLTCYSSVLTQRDIMSIDATDGSKYLHRIGD